MSQSSRYSSSTSKSLYVDLVRRALDLDVAAGSERHLLALGKLQHQLLDEGRHVVVGAHPALPFANTEDLRLELDLHVLLDLHLARQATAGAGLAAADVRGLGRQQRAAAVMDVDLAHAAGSLAAAGGGNEDAVGGQRVEQRAAGRCHQGLVRIVVDGDGDVAAGHQLRLGEQEHQHLGEDHQHEDRDCEEDGWHLSTPLTAESRRRP